MRKIYITGNVLSTYNLFEQNRQISLSIREVCEITKFSERSMEDILRKLYKKALLNRKLVPARHAQCYSYSFNGDAPPVEIIDGHPWDSANRLVFRHGLPELNAEIDELIK